MAGHVPRFGRTKLGKRNVSAGRAPGGYFYGTTVRCSCGWRTQVNQAPSKGGNERAAELHEQHARVAAGQ